MSDNENKENSWVKIILSEYALAGATSGFMTRGICQPFDVLKIRFQLQTEPISKHNVNSKYRSIFQAFRLIVKEEGVKGLWRGHVAAQMLSISYSLVQFNVYENLKIKANEPVNNNNDASSDPRLLNNFVFGALAGCAATVISFPFDVIRTRLIAQGNNKQYSGICHGLSNMYKTEGVLSYWRGLTPSLIVAGPLIGLQFMFYEFFKRLLVDKSVNSVKTEDVETVEWKEVVGKLLAGSLSGIFSKLITYPFDLARKRMQIQDFQHARVGFGSNFWCTGLLTCFVYTLKHEKIAGMYKGLTVAILKSSLNTGMHFGFYEMSLTFFKQHV